MSTPTPLSTLSASRANLSPPTETDPADKIGGEKGKGTLTDWLQAELKKTIRHLQFLETTANLAWWWCTLLMVLGIAIALDHWLWALPTFARYLFWLTGISVSVFWLLRRILPLFVFRIHPLYAAKVVEEALPELKNRLISWWELKHQPQAAPRGVVAAVGRQAVAHLRTHDSSALLDTRPMIISLSIALGLTVFISLYSLVAPRSAWTTAERILFPWMSIAPPARVQILQVQPGSSIIPQSLPCPIGVEVSGLLSDEKVFVRFTSADRQILDQRLELNAKLAGSSYEGLLTTDSRGMQQDVEYWVEAGDAVAGPYSLQVNPLPQLSINKVRLIYPAYTKLPPTEQNSDGNLDAIEGTRVELTTTLTGDAQKTFAEFFSLSPDNKPQRSLRVEPVTLNDNIGTTAFTVRLNSQRQNPTQETYTLRAIDRSGHSEPNPLFYPLRVTGDFAPEIRLASTSDSPLKTSPRGSVAVQLNALDPDFGLSSVELEVRKGNFLLETLSLLDDAEGLREPWNKKFQIRVAKWRLLSGDRITLTAIAKDNRKQPGTESPEPNVVRSNSLEIEITDPPEPEKNNAAGNPEEKNAPPVEEMTEKESTKNDAKQESQSGREKQSSKSSENGKNSQPSNSGSGTASEGASPSEPQNPDNNSGGSSSSSEPSSTKSQNNSSSSSEKNDPQKSGQPNSQGSRSGENQNSNSKPDSDSAQSPPPEHDGDIMERLQQRVNQEQNKNGNSPSQAEKNPQQNPPQNENQNPHIDSKAPSENNSDTMNAADSPKAADSNSKPNSRPQNPDNQNPDNQNPRGQNPRGQNQVNRDGENPNQGDKNPDDKKAGEKSSDKDSGNSQSGNENSDPSSGQSNSSETKSGEPNPRDSGAKPEDRSGNNSNKNMPQTSDPSGANPPKNQAQGEDENRPEKNGASDKGESDKGESDRGASDRGASDKGASDKGASENGTREEAGMNNGKGKPGNRNESGRGKEGDGKEGDRKGENSKDNSQPNSDQRNDDPKVNGEQDSDQKGKNRQPGNEQGKPNQAGSEGGAKENALSSGDASESKGGQPGQRPGNQANQASKPSSASGEPNGSMPGDNSQGTDANDGAESANLDYAKEATNLALEYLERQKDQPDPELLKEMNWTKEDLNRFLDRWKKTLESVDKQGGNRELAEQDLRSLGLRPPKSKAAGVRGDEDQFRNLQDGGPRVTPPKSLKSQFESVKKALQQRQSSPATPAQK